MTRQEHEALAAKALAWVSNNVFADHELESFIIATLDESTGLVFPTCDGCGETVKAAVTPPWCDGCASNEDFERSARALAETTPMSSPVERRGRSGCGHDNCHVAGAIPCLEFVRGKAAEKAGG